MSNLPTTYTVTEVVCEPCAECDAEDLGDCNRLDHGCAKEIGVLSTESLRAARMHAGKRRKATGRLTWVEGPDGAMR